MTSFKTVVVLLATLSFSLSTLANEAELAQVMQQIEALKAQVERLQQKLEQTDQVAQQANQVAEIAVESIEEGSSALSALEGISIGGYGELHYNDLDSGRDIDFHRFVLFLGKQFTDKLSFFSEIELEHSLAGDGKPGEVELEQAYIEYRLSDSFAVKAGQFLVPIGILNETHEPPTFYGVERNGIEKEIIPSTWWEGGAAISHHSLSGWSYDVALHSGLKVPTEGKNAFRIRSGRQKVAKAVAEDLAVTGRVRYTGVPGLELSVSAQHQQDITQGLLDVSATLLEAHAIYQTGPFSLRALYADWDIDGVQAETLGKDSQNGFYLEPSYRFNDAWSVFARYGEYDTTAGLSNSEPVKQFDLGLNWNLHENVVLKADFQNQSGSKDDDGFNLGVGYHF